MQIENSLGSVKAQVAVSVHKESQNTSANLTNKLMSDSLEGTAAMNQSRASQGIGTNLNVTA